MDHMNPSAAIERLQAAVPIELAQIGFVTNISCLYPTYIRGHIWQWGKSNQPQPSSRKFSTTAASSGIAGREHWRT